MHLIKHMSHVSLPLKERWVGPRFSKLYFETYPWVIVDRPFTNNEQVVMCHKTYEGARQSLARLLGPSRSPRSAGLPSSSLGR